MTIWPDYSLSNSIHRLLMKLDTSSVIRLFHDIKSEGYKRGMLYEEDNGGKRSIYLMLRPRLINNAQKKYFSKTCQIMNQAFAKLGKFYLEIPEVQELFPFTPEEKEWMLTYLPKSIKTPRAILSRWDANTNFSGKQWKASFHFLEVNAVGVGGLHYTPTAEGIILDTVIKKLHEQHSHLKIDANEDIRQSLFFEIKHHLKILGQKRCHIGLLQDTRSKGGPLDFFYMQNFFEKQGIKTKIVDPRDLHMKKDEIMAKDFSLDILYRDTTLEEFIEMKHEGHRLLPIQKAFEKNRVISHLGGELDHKSAFEIFSNPKFNHLFTLKEQKCFQHHIPWTRIIREVKTTNPKGVLVDLMSYAIRHQENLVFKPNRGYGGDGIIFGDSTNSQNWGKALQKALHKPGAFILQEKCTIPKKKFPWLTPKGKLTEKSLNVVCGFIYSPYGLGILGRASGQDIVNVAQQGGMTAILTCKNK